MPTLTPHTFPLFQCESFRGAALLQKYLLPCGLSRRCNPSGNIHLLHSGPPQAAKSLLQHLNHFLPSSFFDHGVTRLFITLFPSLFISMTCFPLSKIHFPRGTASMAERLSCVMCESVGATWNCWCPSQHSYSLSSQSPLPSPYGRGLGTCTSDNLEFPELVMSSAANMSSFLSSQGNTTFIQMVAQ